MLIYFPLHASRIARYYLRKLFARLSVYPSVTLMYSGHGILHEEIPKCWMKYIASDVIRLLNITRVTSAGSTTVNVNKRIAQSVLYDSRTFLHYNRSARSICLKWLWPVELIVSVFAAASGVVGCRLIEAERAAYRHDDVTQAPQRLNLSNYHTYDTVRRQLNY